LKKLLEKQNKTMAFTLISITIELAVLFVFYRTLFFTVLKRSIKQVFEKQT